MDWCVVSVTYTEPRKQPPSARWHRSSVVGYNQPVILLVHTKHYHSEAAGAVTGLFIWDLGSSGFRYLACSISYCFLELGQSKRIRLQTGQYS